MDNHRDLFLQVGRQMICVTREKHPKRKPNYQDPFKAQDFPIEDLVLDNIQTLLECDDPCLEESLFPYSDSDSDQYFGHIVIETQLWQSNQYKYKLIYGLFNKLFIRQGYESQIFGEVLSSSGEKLFIICETLRAQMNCVRLSPPLSYPIDIYRPSLE